MVALFFARPPVSTFLYGRANTGSEDEEKGWTETPLSLKYVQMNIKMKFEQLREAVRRDARADSNRRRSSIRPRQLEFPLAAVEARLFRRTPVRNGR
jgi:hypothetical protein